MPLLESIRQDAHFALRTLGCRPGLTGVAILSLAFGIGSATAMFSVTNALMLKLLPVFEPERLVEVPRSDTANVHSTAIWLQIRSQQDIFSSVLAYGSGPFDLAAGGEKRRVSGLFVSGDYFKTLGLVPILGRVLANSDDQPGAAPVCVISYGLWQRQFGESAKAIGARLALQGYSFEIVGITPRRFFGVDVGESFEVIIPIEAERTLHPFRPAQASWLSVVGRLKPGITVAQADARLRTLGPGIFKASLPPGADESDWQSLLQKTLTARTMPNGISWTRYVYGDAVLLLLGAVVVLLLTACLNLANLLLARAAGRRGEIATRLALGAGRARLVRQLLTESVVLSVPGVALGLLLSRWACQALISSVSTSRVPINLDLAWDPRVVAFSVAATVFCILVVGLVPALHATRVSLDSSLRHRSGPVAGFRMYSGTLLLILQVGLSMVLLITAGLLGRTLRALLAQNLGYVPNGVLLAEAGWETGNDGPQRQAFLGDEMLKEFRSIPGIVSASAYTSAAAAPPALVALVPGGSERRARGFPIFVSDGYFQTQQTPLRAGRDFGPRDTGASPAVAILSEAAAGILFPGVNPLGLTLQQLSADQGVAGSSLEIVGIAANIQYRRPNDVPLPILYRPISQCPLSCGRPGTFELRFAGSLQEIQERVKSAARRVDTHLALDFRLLSDDVNQLIQRERLTAALSGAFSLLTLALAVIGIYGITSFRAWQRTFEIGVRRALGAQPRNVLSLIVGETIGRVAAGVALGALAGFGAARAIQGILYGVVPADPLTFGLAACLMFAVAIVAAFLPARRASQADPVSALRAE